MQNLYECTQIKINYNAILTILDKVKKKIQPFPLLCTHYACCMYIRRYKYYIYHTYLYLQGVIDICSVFSVLSTQFKSNFSDMATEYKELNDHDS